MIALSAAGVLGGAFIAAGVIAVAIFYVLASAGAEPRSAVVLLAGFVLLVTGWIILN